MIYTILIPFIAGAFVKAFPFKKRAHKEIFLETMVILNSILVWYLILNSNGEVFTLANFTGGLYIAFKIDGLSKVFAGLVSFLWPLATLYAFEYMTKEEREDSFFMFYTMTYGVTLGIAMSENILTMYFFYEFLTLITVPLVMHTLTREAILASRKYLYYSLGGAAFGFIGMIFIIIYGFQTSFQYGGVFAPVTWAAHSDVLLVVYILAFMGFGVKAAICPFNSWLPDAGVAPTPVTALLHAVAVVKSGAFAIIRLTYYCYGAEKVKDTWAQNVLMIVIIFTIVYGCSRAVKETHIKRRLAYSTISNLSYILFGVIILTPAGLLGGLCHLVFHAFMKIASFFCAGSIMHQTEKHYVYELDGLGKCMPKVFTIFTVSAFALMGVPGLAGFISKWYLCQAAVSSGNILACVGIGGLLISALLTAIYMLTIIVRAFFPGKDFDYSKVEESKDPNWKMILPLTVFTVVTFIFGIYSAPFAEFFYKVAYGLI
ncbi:MAG: proton-conducting transporter membrane subunit [Lachnospiraceae bacterium]|nr:proton-conducting transporter membrane subunit [Lachnospiraceae bacterium]